MNQDTHGKILVVDDAEGNRRMLVDFLSAQGHECVAARDGAEALAHLRSDPPDLVLLDVDMPGLDGLGVLEAIRGDQGIMPVPVIMISGVEDRRVVARCIELGADDFLPKPFDPVLLKARVGASLWRKRTRDRERRLSAELEENVRALRQAEALRDAMSNMLVHDLATPLSVIRMNVELLALKQSMGLFDPDALKSGLDKISAASETLSRLVQGILDVARLESGQMNVRLSLVDCPPLLADVAETFAGTADERGVRIVVGEGSGHARVFADEDLLRRMLQNLVANAIKYGGTGAIVTIRVESTGDSTVLSVSDDGPGIPEQALGHVFEAFYRAPSADSTRYFGVGLGLAFCRLAAEAQGASISVRSAPGTGTTFSIEFR